MPAELYRLLLSVESIDIFLFSTPLQIATNGSKRVVEGNAVLFSDDFIALAARLAENVTVLIPHPPVLIYSQNKMGKLFVFCKQQANSNMRWNNLKEPCFIMESVGKSNLRQFRQTIVYSTKMGKSRMKLGFCTRTEPKPKTNNSLFNKNNIPNVYV